MRQADGRVRGVHVLSLPSPRIAFGELPLSRKGRGICDLLAPLPVAALRLPPGPTRTLELLGLKTIGAARRRAAAEPGAAVSRGGQSA